MTIHNLLTVALMSSLILGVFVGPALAKSSASTIKGKHEAKRAGSVNPELDALYRRAQRRFTKHDYKGALPLLESYIAQAKPKKYKAGRLFGVIDQIGRIHLRENRDPDSATEFFTTFRSDKRLSDAEIDVVDGWLAAATEWKVIRKKPRAKMSDDELFEHGKRYFEDGMLNTQFVGDEGGQAHFHISAGYLFPFIVENNNDPRIGEALYMMGVLRRNAWTDSEYWTHNFYLREVIRRRPHTPIAQKAFVELKKDVHFGYSGSGGDYTPPSVIRMLKEFEILAKPLKKKAKSSMR